MKDTLKRAEERMGRRIDHLVEEYKSIKSEKFKTK